MVLDMASLEDLEQYQEQPAASKRGLGGQRGNTLRSPGCMAAKCSNRDRWQLGASGRHSSGPVYSGNRVGAR